MGDAGEALVDAEDRYQERVAEREGSRTRSEGGPAIDPERERRVRSLTLGKAELQRQQQVTTNAVRLAQIGRALEDIERQLHEV